MVFHLCLVKKVNMYYGNLDSDYDSKVKVDKIYGNYNIDGDLLYYKLKLYNINQYIQMIIPNGERSSKHNGLGGLINDFNRELTRHHADENLQYNFEKSKIICKVSKEIK